MSDSPQSMVDTIARVLSIAGLVVIAYVGGAYTAEFETFPYPQLLERPFRALEAWRQKRNLTAFNPAKSSQWNRVRDWKTGIVSHDRTAASGGYRLFTSAHASAAFLIDDRGRLVHQWSKRFREAFPDHGAVSNPVPESKISWADAHVFPNGDAIGAYAADGDTPYAYGLVKLNRNSEVLWTWAGHPHHDFDVQPDGTIWLLDQAFRDTSEDPIPNVPNWKDRVLEGFAVQLSAEGEELARIPLLDAYARHHGDEFEQWFTGSHRWDPIHANDVEVLQKDFTEHHYFAEPGQLLISSRALDSISILDPQSGEIVWTKRGFWKKQHDPDPRPHGEILLFDNQGYQGPGGASRVVQFDPQTLRISWSFHGTREQRFHCTWWGKQTPLSGGNVLIADSLNGRILEVNRDREIVWEWHTPSVASFKGNQYVPNIKAPVERIAPESLQFEPDRPKLAESLLPVDARRFGEQ